MCRRVTCKSCSKPTWAGCGAHIEQVLGDVPKSARCGCREKKAAAPKADSAPTAGKGGVGAFFKRILGG